MDIQEKELPLQVPLQAPVKEADQEEVVKTEIVKTARLTDQGEIVKLTDQGDTKR